MADAAARETMLVAVSVAERTHDHEVAVASGLATSHPSPWADHALAMAEARAAQAAETSAEEGARRVAVANAEKTRGEARCRS